MRSELQDKLDKYLKGELSPDERAKMDEWLDSLATPGEQQQTAWTREAQAKLLLRIKEKMKEQDEQHVTPAKAPVRFWMSMAAAVAAIIAISWWVVPQVMNPVIGITDARDELRKVLLADGTLVWLRENASIRYSDSSAQERHAALTGEALFEVAKNSDRPFIITCGDVSVKVVGTSFTLRSSPDSIHLRVLTGKVKVFSSLDTTGVIVLPRQQLVYASTGKHRTEGFTEAPAYVKASEYNMSFKDATLSQVFSRIEKKFNITVQLQTTAIGKCKVTADLTDVSLDSALAMIASVHGITYSIEGSTVTVAGNGCL